MIPSDPREVALVLQGAMGGAGLVLLLTFAAFGLHVWRQGWSEGTLLSGEAMEQNRKRSES